MDLPSSFSLFGSKALDSFAWTLIDFLFFYLLPFFVGLGILLSIAILFQSKNLKNPLDIWRNLDRFPTFLRKWLFTRMLWYRNPFSKRGNVQVELLERGKCICKVKETSSLRNPFYSLHAAELILLGETSAGLALFSVLTSNQRAIVTEIKAHYFKKARGIIVSVSKCNCTYEGHTHVISELREGNESGSLVATVAVVFTVGSNETKKHS